MINKVDIINRVNDFMERLQGIVDATPYEKPLQDTSYTDTEVQDYSFPSLYYQENIQEPDSNLNQSDNKSISTNTTISTPGSTGISDAMFKILTDYEGTPWGKQLSKKELNGYGNDAGHLTYGYGLLYHPEQNKFMDQVQRTYSQKELERLALVDMTNRTKKVKEWANKNNISLNQNQLDAIVCATHNFGLGFLKSRVAAMIKNNPNDPAIKDVWTHMSDLQANKQKLGGLKKRRAFEANWYFTGHK